MSQFLDLVSQFQQVPTMPKGLSRAVSRHGAARHQGKLDDFNASVTAATNSNAAVMGDMLSLGGESAMSMMDSLGDFAQNALSGLFGGSTGQSQAAPAASGAAQGPTTAPASPSLHEASTPLQSRMGMGENLLSRGSRGPEVKTMQNNLKELGFDIDVDGIFGPETEAALREFQGGQKVDDEAIAVDGILGPETSQALSNSAKETASEDPNGAGDGAKAENMAADRAASLNGAGDGAKAENMAAERAGNLNGAGDGAKAQNAAADKAGSQNGAGDGAKAENAGADKGGDSKGSKD